MGESGDRERLKGLNVVYWTKKAFFTGNFVCGTYAFGGNKFIIGILRKRLKKWKFKMTFAMKGRMGPEDLSN